METMPGTASTFSFPDSSIHSNPVTLAGRLAIFAIAPRNRPRSFAGQVFTTQPLWSNQPNQCAAPNGAVPLTRQCLLPDSQRSFCHCRKRGRTRRRLFDSADRSRTIPLLGDLLGHYSGTSFRESSARHAGYRERKLSYGKQRRGDWWAQFSRFTGTYRRNCRWPLGVVQHILDDMREPAASRSNEIQWFSANDLFARS